MARNSEPREDLLRDARALTPRMLLRVTFDGRDVELFAGFRGESLSLYFDDEPVYHFNARGELRRAFIDGRIVKAEHARLVFLERELNERATILRPSGRSGELQAALVADLTNRLQHCRAALRDSQYSLVGQEPKAGDPIERLTRWLASREEVTIAASPRVT